MPGSLPRSPLTGDSRLLSLRALCTQWGVYLLNWNDGEGVSSSSKGITQAELRTHTVDWLPENNIEEPAVCKFFPCSSWVCVCVGGPVEMFPKVIII